MINEDSRVISQPKKPPEISIEKDEAEKRSHYVWIVWQKHFQFGFDSQKFANQISSVCLRFSVNLF